MKKDKAHELNRYFLVSYHGTVTKVVQTVQEYEDILASIEKYDKNINSKYIYGNVSMETHEDGIHVISHIYNRLTQPLTLSEILEYTTRYSKDEISMIYRDDCEMLDGYIPDINIAYYQNKSKNNDTGKHYDKRIKYLQMLYKEDKQYLSLGYILKCMHYHADPKVADYAFFRGLANEISIYKSVEKEVSTLFSTVDLCEHQGLNPEQMYIVAELLVKKFVKERNRDGSYKRDEDGNVLISKRRLMDVGVYVKFSGDLSKKKSPLKYNEGPDNQKKIELRKEAENYNVLKLQKEGKYKYKQLSLFEK